jgi:hypothetical protein
VNNKSLISWCVKKKVEFQRRQKKNEKVSFTIVPYLIDPTTSSQNNFIEG